MGQKKSKEGVRDNPVDDVVVNKPLRSRKDGAGARQLLKSCFGKKLFSLVPFEIWKMIVAEADTKSIFVLYKTCWGFKELVDDFGRFYFETSRKVKREWKFDLSMKCLERSVTFGNVEAMFELAVRLNGWSPDQDLLKAVKWFGKAAKRGHCIAMVYYSFCFRNNSGIVNNKSVELSKAWGQLALETGDPLAIGLCTYFDLGFSGIIDKGKAFACFKQSAEGGNDLGQYWFGYCYHFALGVDQNFENAFHWFSKSAEQGFVWGCYQLGLMYEHGLGCVANMEKAIFWLEKANSQSHEDAAVSLKRLYEHKKFIEQLSLIPWPKNDEK